MNEEKPSDYAETLRLHFSSAQRQGDTPRFKMSPRNQRKLERIREKVRELKGGR